MRVHLLFPDRDLILEKQEKPEWTDRSRDLGLSLLLDAMAREDREILAVCRQVLNSPQDDENVIRYRQEILTDCMAAPQTLRELYRICIATEEKRRNCWYRLNSPSLANVHSSAVDLIRIYLEGLTAMRHIADNCGGTIRSHGLRSFFSMLQQELSDAYLAEARKLLSALGESGGILISAGFGSYLQGISYVYRRKHQDLSRLQWLLAPSFTLGEQDISGFNDLSARRDRAINEAANGLAQAAEHLERFTDQLRYELGFYAGALNLKEALEALNLPVSIPRLGKTRMWQGLYDGSLALTCGKTVVGNDLSQGNERLYIITGANQGGKTTFLRSVGQCQLMGQCGLFVCSAACCLPVRGHIFTHFKREEDKDMDSGRLDEELRRMSSIADRIGPGDMILFNESFASTNEREGSEIFRQITQALTEKEIEIFSVTHLLEYALSFAGREDIRYLRAQRLEDGTRTFRLEPGMPLATAYGQDICRKIFGRETLS